MWQYNFPSLIKDVGGHKKIFTVFIYNSGAYYRKYFLFKVRSLEITSPHNKRMLLLQNISFEIRGGEIMAVLATSGKLFDKSLIK